MCENHDKSAQEPDSPWENGYIEMDFRGHRLVQLLGGGYMNKPNVVIFMADQSL